MELAQKFKILDSTNRLTVIEGDYKRTLLADDTYEAYGAVLREYTSDSIDNIKWEIPVAENTSASTVNFSKLNLPEDELRLVKAFAVDILSRYSSPRTCIKHISNLEYLFGFLEQKRFRIEMISTTVLNMLSEHLDYRLSLPDVKKNEIESTVSIFVDFLKAFDILRPGPIGTPSKRKIAPSPVIEAPEAAVMMELDKYFFNLNNDIPSDYRCIYLLFRLIPNRIGEVTLMRLNSFKINGELLEIETPTFKESPMHKASYEKYELLRDGRVESILLRALETQKTYAASQQAQLTERYRGFLMISTEHMNRLTNRNDFNGYLKSTCAQLALTNYKGDAVEITSHALRHAIIAEFSGNSNIGSNRIREMSNHSRTSMTMGYGYCAESDRRKKTAPIIKELHTALEGSLLPNTVIEPMTLSEKAFRKKQMDGNSRLLDADTVCSEMSCRPQYEHCIMECEGYRPNPEYIPLIKSHCATLEKRIDSLKYKGHTELLEFNERQLAVYKRFLERAEV